MYKIGYTAGAFDMFHVGHLNILEKMKALCNKLIVGVSTDESMLKFKGFTPVIQLKERMRIVEALKCVDGIVTNAILEHDQTQIRLKFDVFIIGDDWKGRMDDVEDRLLKQGCDTIYLSRTPDVSTTEMRNIINLRRAVFI